MPGSTPDEVAEIVRFVRAASRLALPGFLSGDLGQETKADGTEVTAYDKAVERALRDEIGARYPDDAILGEEEGSVDGTSGRRWVLDPIDGTSPYARGVVTWGTLVGLEDEHGPLLGVVSCPWADEVVWAGRGAGCWFGDRAAHVSDRADLDGAVLATSSLRHWPEGALTRVLAAGVHVVTWGNAYGLGLAATGRVDAFFDHGVKPWDLSPAPVLMSEGGGTFSALDGTARIDRGSGLLATPALQGPLLDLLRG